jgi:hypothetical protein
MAVRMKDRERSWALNQQHSKLLRIARTIAAETRCPVLKDPGAELSGQLCSSRPCQGQDLAFGLVVPDLLQRLFCRSRESNLGSGSASRDTALISFSDEDLELEIQEIK